MGTIGGVYEVSDTQEISVNYNGCNYLVIFGRHVNGWYIAIPNWGKCVEAANPEDIFYNTERLSEVFEPETAEALARTIAAYGLYQERRRKNETAEEANTGAEKEDI